jgi:hypothetical protein
MIVILNIIPMKGKPTHHLRTIVVVHKISVKVMLIPFSKTWVLCTMSLQTQEKE